MWPGVELGVGGAGQADSGCVVGGGGEAGAVEPAVLGAVAAPYVGQSALAAGVVDRDQCGFVGCLDRVAVAGAYGLVRVGRAVGAVDRCEHGTCGRHVLGVGVGFAGWWDWLGA